ncbi:peptidylprolyl isomerase [Cellulosilyticum sp. ST5]|uniref:peptidylprolyl isomerase n=1 Tax=unclassified Cellulosilyticum TaxID=2643091 RepID=UPI000F8E7724|nr:peptidylprolyl isomerase [Cellulosilyticum sp. WCF-2]QEH67922.1 peptidylprolyl isomerase [Cellulosilyticum sp. WCF-2]
MNLFQRRYLKNVIGLIFLMTALIVGAGCNQVDNNKDQANNSSESTEKVQVEAIQTTPIVTMIVKDYGTVTLELYPDMAPNTVNNFITLANDGFYDGLTFHRIIKDFMIQGGDPDGIGTGGPGYSIAGEFSNNGYTANTLLHTKGVISMARSMAPDSAGSQFFIMTADTPSLDGNYAAFGKVTSGLDIIEEIGNVETDSSDKPIEDVVIESIRVETNGIDVPPVIKIEE